MIALFFTYSFMAGACYAVGLGELRRDKRYGDRHKWLNRPLALIAGLVWPLLFLFFISAKVRRAVFPPNVEITGPAYGSGASSG